MAAQFGYLDLGSFRDIYCSSPDEPKMRFYIEGVRCGKCVQKIEALENQVPGISSLRLNLSDQVAQVELISSHQSFELVAQKIQELGFKPIPLKARQAADVEWRKESRSDLIRLAIAGFCAGNIMMFAFAIYFGVQGEMKNIFEYLQFFLYLPVVSFVALPFYRGFLQGIKQRSITIDAPMAIVSTLSFIISSYHLFSGEGSIYFDSTSGFLFLILGTRFFQKNLRHRYLGSLKPSSVLENAKARRLKGSEEEWVPVQNLQILDQVQILKGEIIPVDGILNSPKALVDVSFFNGENLPRWISQAGLVQAGSICLSDEIIIVVKNTEQDSQFTKLLNSVVDKVDNNDEHQLSNLASQVLLGVVIFVCLILLLIPFEPFSLRFEKAFALLVLACPCAMAFGTPLAFSFSIQEAFRQGILIKSTKVFDHILKVQDLFLDKTGTLTKHEWALEGSSLVIIPEEYKRVVLLLEASSQHPIAYAFRELWKNLDIRFELVKDWEKTERGVRAIIGGEQWEIKADHSQESKRYHLYRNNILVWFFNLTPALQPQAKETLNEIKKSGLKVHLLTGDHKREALRVAKDLEIDFENVHFNLTPEQKKKIVAQVEQSCMVGDGYNDSLALQEAKVGIAVATGVDLAFRAADVVFLKEGLKSILILRKLAQQAQRTIRRNLAIALIYNSLGGIAAVMGLINPFVAALLMPISSLVILASSWWGLVEKKK